MTKEEELALEKIYMSTRYLCLRITPYMEFSNGTKGSVLLVDFNTNEPYLLLFNSPARADGSENSEHNFLLLDEAERFIKYRNECLKRDDDAYCMSQEAYEEYGVALLADRYMSSYLADYFCNILNQDPNGLRSWRTGRVFDLLNNSISEFALEDIDDGVSDFLSESSTWRRTIVSQTIFLHSKQKTIVDEMKKALQEAREVYVGWLEREEIPFKLFFAHKVMSEYLETKQPVDWTKRLEEAFEFQRNNPQDVPLHYLDFGIQEIIGYYALSKYLYTQKPEKMEPHYAAVSLQERVKIFDLYKDGCAKEMYQELMTKDDPLRAHLPTMEEAYEEAKKRIATRVGSRPEGLTEEQQRIYDQFEEGFFKSIGLTYIDITIPQELESPSRKQYEIHFPEDMFPKFKTIDFYDKLANEFKQNYPDVMESGNENRFSKLITHNNPKFVLEVLHSRIDNRKGKAIGIVLAAAAYKYHVLNRTPTEKEFRGEFTNIQKCSWRSISVWLKKVNKQEDLHPDIQEVELPF